MAVDQPYGSGGPGGIEIDFEGGGPVLPVPLPVPAASGPVVTVRARLLGYGLRESSGTAGARLDLFDGQDGTGQPAVPITLSAGQSVRDWFGPHGITCKGGIFAQLVSGAVAGSIYVRMEVPGR